MIVYPLLPTPTAKDNKDGLTCTGSNRCDYFILRSAVVNLDNVAQTTHDNLSSITSPPICSDSRVTSMPAPYEIMSSSPSTPSKSHSYKNKRALALKKKKSSHEEFIFLFANCPAATRRSSRPERQIPSRGGCMHPCQEDTPLTPCGSKLRF